MKKGTELSPTLTASTADEKAVQALEPGVNTTNNVLGNVTSAEDLEKGSSAKGNTADGAPPTYNSLQYDVLPW